MLLLLLFSQQAYVSLIERGIYWMLIEFLALVLFERVVSCCCCCCCCLLCFICLFTDGEDKQDWFYLETSRKLVYLFICLYPDFTTTITTTVYREERGASESKRRPHTPPTQHPTQSRGRALFTR